MAQPVDSNLNNILEVALDANIAFEDVGLLVVVWNEDPNRSPIQRANQIERELFSSVTRFKDPNKVFELLFVDHSKNSLQDVQEKILPTTVPADSWDYEAG